MALASTDFKKDVIITEAGAKKKLCPILAGFASLTAAFTTNMDEKPRGITYFCVGSKCMWWHSHSENTGVCGVVASKRLMMPMSPSENKSPSTH